MNRNAGFYLATAKTISPIPLDTLHSNEKKEKKNEIEPKTTICYTINWLNGRWNSALPTVEQNHVRISNRLRC